ncbi:hypothetical protein, partial [Natronobacillus azotifigens]|uniref:hypothetical protein n=1 Tax=Natronobacillus azotifigens TaxID=472978 RepID=UPI003D1E3FA0
LFPTSFFAVNSISVTTPLSALFKLANRRVFFSLFPTSFFAVNSISVTTPLSALFKLANRRVFFT